jgi:hypothetical protein
MLSVFMLSVDYTECCIPTVLSVVYTECLIPILLSVIDAESHLY